MKPIKKIEIILTLALVLAAAVSVWDFARDCKAVRQDVLRLHVVADSDSETDQRLKLMVRDAVLKEGKELFNGSVTAQSAEEKITPQIENLEAVAEKTLKENGCDADVKITVAREYFNTRCYDNFTMPAGVYNAVRVNIGSAGGHNWWCVMFPPLCLPAASVQAEAFFTEDEMSVIGASPKYEPRFKIIEVYERIKNRLSD